MPCELYGAKCAIHIAKSSNGSQNVYSNVWSLTWFEVTFSAFDANGVLAISAVLLLMFVFYLHDAVWFTALARVGQVSGSLLNNAVSSA